MSMHHREKAIDIQLAHVIFSPTLDKLVFLLHHILPIHFTSIDLLLVIIVDSQKIQIVLTAYHTRRQSGQLSPRISAIVADSITSLSTYKHA